MVSEKKFLDYCENNLDKALELLGEADNTNMFNDHSHSFFDRCIETALDNLDEDDRKTYKLLENLVKFPGMKTRLLSLSPAEQNLFGIYDSRSPFDKIMDYYLATVKDMDVDRKLESLVKLIHANNRYTWSCNSENTIVGYSKLDELVQTQSESEVTF